jgi:ATP-dependent Clp protease ATP-binding subunit ClpA
MLETMQRKTNNNVLLVGDIGTGKSNLVDNFIYDSYEANLTRRLNHRRFLELTIGPLVAGTANREELETRLQAIIEEVKHSGNVILYVPEFQNLMGSSSFDVDISGAILPYLKDGKMPIIATMTDSEYKRFFEKAFLELHPYLVLLIL